MVFAGWPLHGSLPCDSSGMLQSLGLQRVRHDLVTEQRLAGWRGALGDPALSFGRVPGLWPLTPGLPWAEQAPGAPSAPCLISSESFRNLRSVVNICGSSPVNRDSTLPNWSKTIFCVFYLNRERAYCYLFVCWLVLSWGFMFQILKQVLQVSLSFKCPVLLPNTFG